MNVLVTGAAGFISSAVVRDLAARPEVAVIAVDGLTYAANRKTVEALKRQPRVRFEKADIRDGGAMAALFAAHAPDGVVHLAAETHVDRSIDAPVVFGETNVMGTLTLLETVRAYWDGLSTTSRATFRFVHV